ncbi:MAG: nucleotidyltransferase domain-containing protein [Thermoplasmata archaeon]
MAEGTTLEEVLKDWTTDLDRELGAVHLFDVAYLTTLYRMFLLPGNLQVDLSFTPSSDFGALGPRFRLLFGVARQREHFPKPSARDLLGVGVHHAVRARYSIARDRPWQAEHWITGVREQALTLACLKRGLDWANGRGIDQLPADVLSQATDGRVRSLDRPELLRALKASTKILFREGAGIDELLGRVEPSVRSLGSEEELS